MHRVSMSNMFVTRVCILHFLAWSIALPLVSCLQALPPPHPVKWAADYQCTQLNSSYMSLAACRPWTILSKVLLPAADVAQLPPEAQVSDILLAACRLAPHIPAKLLPLANMLRPGLKPTTKDMVLAACRPSLP